MRKYLTIIVYSFSQNYARESVTEWFSQKLNLTVDSVIPYNSENSYEVSLSYDEDSK